MVPGYKRDHIEQYPPALYYLYLSFKIVSMVAVIVPALMR